MVTCWYWSCPALEKRAPSSKFHGDSRREVRKQDSPKDSLVSQPIPIPHTTKESLTPVTNNQHPPKSNERIYAFFANFPTFSPCILRDSPLLPRSLACSLAPSFTLDSHAERERKSESIFTFIEISLSASPLPSLLFLSLQRSRKSKEKSFIPLSSFFFSSEGATCLGHDFLARVQFSPTKERRKKEAKG